jgi:hypothetical protein
MITPHPSSRLARLFEHSVLTTDVARALRSSVAFTAAWVVCLWAGHPAVAVFAATAAQNLTLQDLRGDYGARLALLLTMTVVLAASVFAGTLTGNNIWSATLMVGALALLGSAWRHLSADYGPNLAIISALLFLFALSQPGDWRAGVLVAGWVSLGCAGGILIQLCGWFIRPQHPVRHAVAESWVAASDLIAAMRTETNAPRTSPEPLAGKESAVRATVDRTLHTSEGSIHRMDSGEIQGVFQQAFAGSKCREIWWLPVSLMGRVRRNGEAPLFQPRRRTEMGWLFQVRACLRLKLISRPQPR